MHAYARARGANYSRSDNWFYILGRRPLARAAGSRRVVAVAVAVAVVPCRSRSQPGLLVGAAAAAPLLNLVNLSLPEINRSQESLCELPRSHSIAYHVHRLPDRPKDVAAAAAAC